MNPCTVAGCDRPGEWHVLRCVEHDPVHGPTHSGNHYAPYRISHIRQADKCLEHARQEADERNLAQRHHD